MLKKSQQLRHPRKRKELINQPRPLRRKLLHQTNLWLRRLLSKLHRLAVPTKCGKPKFMIHVRGDAETSAWRHVLLRAPVIVTAWRSTVRLVSVNARQCKPGSMPAG